jgi:hypothetical protein
MAMFDRAITHKVNGIAIAVVSQRENFPKRGEKVMQIEKAKVLKRVWKAVTYVELAVALVALVFLFSHGFSWDVFVSNFHRQATAASSVQPR